MADIHETATFTIQTNAPQFVQDTQKITKGIKDVQSSASNLGRGFLEASRAIEDMQYGLRGVLNNIPQAVLQFGGPAGLAAGISVAAVAANILYENWSKVKGLFETTTLVPLGTKLEEFDAGLKAVNKDLEELRKKEELTAEETKEFNRLKEAQVILERQITREREAQARVKGLEALRPEQEVAEAKLRADLMKEEFAEPGARDAMISAIVKATPSEVNRLRDQIKHAESELKKAEDEYGAAANRGAAEEELQRLHARMTDLKAMVPGLKQELEAAPARQEARAKQLLADLVIGGREDAWSRISDLMEANKLRRPGLFTEEQRRMMDLAAPDRIGEMVREAKDEELRKKINLQENERLNKQGREGEAMNDMMNDLQKKVFQQAKGLGDLMQRVEDTLVRKILANPGIVSRKGEIAPEAREDLRRRTAREIQMKHPEIRPGTGEFDALVKELAASAEKNLGLSGDVAANQRILRAKVQEINAAIDAARNAAQDTGRALQLPGLTNLLYGKK